MTADEMLRAAWETRDNAMRDMREAFQEWYGHFLKCRACGAEAWASPCQECGSKDLFETGYAPPPRFPGHVMVGYGRQAYCRRCGDNPELGRSCPG